MPDFHVTFRDLLHAVNLLRTWDKRLYFPSGGRRAEDSNPAEAGFEPANLGTEGQHATSRPPKPLSIGMLSVVLFESEKRRSSCLCCDFNFPESRKT